MNSSPLSFWKNRVIQDYASVMSSTCHCTMFVPPQYVTNHTIRLRQGERGEEGEWRGWEQVEGEIERERNATILCYLIFLNKQQIFDLRLYFNDQLVSWLHLMILHINMHRFGWCFIFKPQFPFVYIDYNGNYYECY